MPICGTPFSRWTGRWRPSSRSRSATTASTVSNPQNVYDTRCTAGFVLRTMTATDVAQGFGPNLVALCADAGMASFALVLILSHSVTVGVAVAASLPLSWLIWHATRRRVTNAQHHVWMTMERFTSRTVDTFVELRSVRLSGSTDRFVGGLVEDFDALAESQRAQRIALAVPAALSALLFASLAGLVLWWLGSNVIAGSATAGDLVLVVGTVSLFLGPAQQFPSHLSNLTLALDAVRRVEEVLQRPNEADRGTPDRGWSAGGAVELRHASLRHSGRSHASTTCPSASNQERSSPSSVRPVQARRPSPTWCAASTTPTAATSSSTVGPMPTSPTRTGGGRSQRCSRTAASCSAACATTW